MGFLREVFGPSKEEVWSNLCDEIGGQFIDGGFWKGDKVEAKAGQWTIVLDTYTVSTGKTSTTYTRMRAPFVNADDFYFKIYREGVFSGLGTLLGMQDINIGYEDFDSNFVIKSNDEEKVAQLLSKDEVRRLIDAQPSISLEIKDDEGFFGPYFPEGVDELYFQVPGVLKDLEVLKALYHLFAEVLTQLCYIGSAYENAPDVTL